ncbi:MAG TPA: EamA family transporter [Hyphomicrobium sp.]|jgi:drug/metabolite transporter (DMT)-like permease|nr:EamA family transporter [Hyphomicrobium sp.]
MPVVVFGAVLLAAVLHAAWNALVKNADDKFLTTVIVAASAALLAAIALPFLKQPDPASWPYIGTSAVIHVGYFVLIAFAYHLADMSQTYPLMRGTAPFLVALAGAFLLREPLSSKAWIGISLISLGVLSMVSVKQEGDGKGIALALFNAVVIAGYTLVDGYGVRLSEAPVAYTLWVFLITGIPLACGSLVMNRATAGPHARSNWRMGLLGGFGTLAAYSLVLWAMTAAPVAVVAALRETSILFGTVISALVLNERINGNRWAAVCIIALGAIVLRIAS